MNHTRLPFPRRELSAAQHQQIRELLVREAVPQPVRKFFRARVLLPAFAVLAVGATVAGAGVITRDWNPVTSVPAAVKKLPNLIFDHSEDCGYAQKADRSRGDGLRYLAPLPAGWKYSSWLNQEPYCPVEQPTKPVVTFVKETADRTVTAAVTLWRSLPPEVPSSSSDATSTELKPKGTPPPSGASMAVTVHGRPARLIGLNKLTWTEKDGRRWSLTAAGLAPARLQAIAEGLNLAAGQVRWPTEQEPGYTRYAIPSRPEPAEYTPMATWYICASPTERAECQVQVEINRTAVPWQVALSTEPLPARMVDVNGRPGVIRADRDIKGNAWLSTDTEDGARVEVSGSVPAPSSLVELAGQLRPVAADDPAIHDS
jgi:hypothetical protein